MISFAPRIPLAEKQFIILNAWTDGYLVSDNSPSIKFKFRKDNAKGRWALIGNATWNGCIEKNLQHGFFAYIGKLLNQSGYQTSLRPKGNFGEKLEFNIKYRLNSIHGLSESGLFHTIGEFFFRWQDQVLNWENLSSAKYYSNYSAQFPSKLAGDQS